MKIVLAAILATSVWTPSFAAGHRGIVANGWISYGCDKCTESDLAGIVKWGHRSYYGTMTLTDQIELFATSDVVAKVVNENFNFNSDQNVLEYNAAGTHFLAGYSTNPLTNLSEGPIQ